MPAPSELSDGGPGSDVGVPAAAVGWKAGHQEGLPLQGMGGIHDGDQAAGTESHATVTFGEAALGTNMKVTPASGDAPQSRGNGVFGQSPSPLQTDDQVCGRFTSD